MAVCAVVRIADGVVVNRIVAEPTDPAPDGCMLVDVSDVPCDIGWTYFRGEFLLIPTEVSNDD